MGREVRHVPQNWEHPKNEYGSFIPLFGRSYKEDSDTWDKESKQWESGWRPEYCKDSEHQAMTYEEYSGARPRQEDYMPDWPKEERTHLMMYEDTSEGTPISPAFATAEELARWLVDNKASAFGGMQASYEGWLRAANGGFACSMVFSDGNITSGVDALTQTNQG